MSTSTPSQRKVIVSLTPMAVRQDSRTYKQASSVSRLGYRSIVIEGPDSRLDTASLPFELVASIAPKPAEPKAPPPATVAKPSAPVATSNAAADAADGQLREMQASRGRADEPSATERHNSLADAQAVLVLNGTTKWARYLERLQHDRKAALWEIFNLPWSILRAGLRPLVHVIRAVLEGLLRIKIAARRLVGEIRHRMVLPMQFLRHLRDYSRVYVLGTLRVAPKADLYYLHAFYQFPAVWLLCKRHRAKFVYDAHDFYSHMDNATALSPFWRDWVRPFENWLEYKCAKHASALVTVNQTLADLMQQRFGRPAIVLRNAHDQRLEQPVERTIRQVLGIAPDKFLVVCVGQYKRDAVYDAAIAAMAMAPQHCHLVFLGANFPSFGDLLAKHGVSDRVHFVPAVKPTEVVPFIRGADVGLLVYHAVSKSIENCLPNGFFQPLAAGLPILYPELPEIRRIAAGSDLGWPIDPLQADSVAAAIRHAATDQTRLAAKRANVANSAFSLSWERDEAILGQALEKLLSRR